MNRRCSSGTWNIRRSMDKGILGSVTWLKEGEGCS